MYIYIDIWSFLGNLTATASWLTFDENASEALSMWMWPSIGSHCSRRRRRRRRLASSESRSASIKYLKFISKLLVVNDSTASLQFSRRHSAHAYQCRGPAYYSAESLGNCWDKRKPKTANVADDSLGQLQLLCRYLSSVHWFMCVPVLKVNRNTRWHRSPGPTGSSSPHAPPSHLMPTTAHSCNCTLLVLLLNFILLHFPIRIPYIYQILFNKPCPLSLPPSPSLSLSLCTLMTVVINVSAVYYSSW